MRVLYDHQTFLLQRRGGISRYFYELITRMAAISGVGAHVFMGLHINEYGLEKSRGQCEGFFAMRRPDLPHLLTASLFLNGLLLSRFARSSKPDIYHQTYYYSLIRNKAFRRVVTVFDMIYELYPHDYVPDDVTAPNKRRAVNDADGIICISEATRIDLLNILHPSEKKVKVIYLANSLTTPALPPSRLGYPYVLFVGKRGGYKNFDLLLNAFTHSTRIKNDFWLVCFGGGRFTESEMERITAAGIADKIRYIDGPDDLLSNVYGFASALVVASLHEGFGMPILEAMHYRCPVIASRTSCMPEIAGNAAEYFDPRSENELIAALEKVLYSEGDRSRMVSAGILREGQFSWDACAKETLDFYRSLL